jgi:hypothetical protein
MCLANAYNETISEYLTIEQRLNQPNKNPRRTFFFHS